MICGDEIYIYIYIYIYNDALNSKKICITALLLRSLIELALVIELCKCTYVVRLNQIIIFTTMDSKCKMRYNLSAYCSSPTSRHK